MWAILSDPTKRGRGWDEDEFFATGVTEIDGLIERIEGHGMMAGPGAALDFGCGYGRLSRALADRIGRTTGIDISSSMIEGAKRLNVGHDVEFFVNDAPDLALFDDARFDVIYSNIVLQHVPSQTEILHYVEEFVRVLKPGGSAVFQIPATMPWKYRIQPIARAYRLLRAVGFSAEFLLQKLKLQPIRMTAVAVHDVTARVEHAGGRVVAVDTETQVSGSDWAIYFVTR